jgi:hypothetical protein
MALTKVSNSMIAGAPISVFDYMTPAQIAAVQTGIYGSVTPAEITAAIQASLNAASTGGAFISNKSWIMPEGQYQINDVLQYPQAGVIEVAKSQLVFEGTITQTDDTKSVLRFNNLGATGMFDVVIKGPKIFGPNSQQYANGASAVIFDGIVSNCEVEFPYIFGGFTYGVAITPNGIGSCLHNKFTMGYCRGPQYGFYVRSDGSVGNFFNANAIYGGDYACPFLAAANTAGFTVYGIYGTDFQYSNSYYYPAFAVLNFGIRWRRSIGWAVIVPYFDSPVSGEIAADLTACAQGTWTHGYTDFDDLTFIKSTDTRANTFINTGTYTPGVPNMSIDNDGIIFTFPQAPTLLDGNTLSYIPTFYCLASIDNQGTVQYLNKEAEGTSATPSSGSYRKGAIVWNTTTVATGQRMGYMCSADGTMGTLAGVTGSITVGTSTLVVNDATNLKYGQNISVAGAVTGQVILGISGTTITLSGVASATVASVAVSFFPATWVAMPNFA